jgi:hypothetical protein
LEDEGKASRDIVELRKGRQQMKSQFNPQRQTGQPFFNLDRHLSLLALSLIVALSLGMQFILLYSSLVPFHILVKYCRICMLVRTASSLFPSFLLGKFCLIIRFMCHFWKAFSHPSFRIGLFLRAPIVSSTCPIRH